MSLSQQQHMPQVPPYFFSFSNARSLAGMSDAFEFRAMPPLDVSQAFTTAAATAFSPRKWSDKLGTFVLLKDCRSTRAVTSIVYYHEMPPRSYESATGV